MGIRLSTESPSMQSHFPERRFTNFRRCPTDTPLRSGRDPRNRCLAESDCSDQALARRCCNCRSADRTAHVVVITTMSRRCRPASSCNTPEHCRRSELKSFGRQRFLGWQQSIPDAGFNGAMIGIFPGNEFCLTKSSQCGRSGRRHRCMMRRFHPRDARGRGT